MCNLKEFLAIVQTEKIDYLFLERCRSNRLNFFRCRKAPLDENRIRNGEMRFVDKSH